MPSAMLGEEARNLGGIVLQVGVERHDDVAAGRGEAGRQRGRLAEVAAKADAVDTLACCRASSAMTSHEPSVLPSSTKTTSTSRSPGGAPSPRSRRGAAIEAVLLVVDGNDERDHSGIGG